MTRILSMFESRDAKRARVEAEIVERSERFRASPIINIGSVTALNPTFEGPNPYEDLVDPENHGVLVKPTEPAMRKRAKSETPKKTPWPKDDHGDPVTRNPRYSAPPLTSSVSDEDPFHKDPLNKSAAAANSFSLEIEEEKRRAQRRTVGYVPTDYLHVDIPDERLCI